MGLALARGWIKGGLPPSSLVLVDPFAGEAAHKFAADNRVRLLKSTENVLTHVLVLAVKPQSIREAMDQVVPSVGRQTLVLSIAAGISLRTLAAGLDTERVVRSMPNTPAQIGKGITGAVGLEISNADRALVEDLLGAVGDVVWFEDESKLDAVTAVSGSGPAYVFYLVEALAVAGPGRGLTKPPRRGRRSTRSEASSSRKAFWTVLTETWYWAASWRVVGTRLPGGHWPVLILSRNSRASLREMPSTMAVLLPCATW